MERSSIGGSNLMIVIVVGFFMLSVFFNDIDNVMAGGDIKMDSSGVAAEKLSKLNDKRIFFGHQSVGYNILDGVKMLQEKNSSIGIKEVKLKSPDELRKNGNGVIFHSEMGTNFDPRSKIDDFSSWMNKGIGGNVDIAFLKFCFVDIGTQTDLNALFDYYKKTMADLKKQYPSTTFVHLTVPLVSELTGVAYLKHKFKGLIKIFLGKNEFYENVKKFTYNEMIRREYAGKEPVFDLAAIESTFPDGNRSVFVSDGKNIETMVPGYTNDGGHLAMKGKKVVAEKMLVFLADLP